MRAHDDERDGSVLDGATALVTGAAGGLGREFCVTLAQAGASVAGIDIADLSATTSAVEAVGGTSLSLRADVTDPDAMTAACREVVARFGSLEIVVVNAGTYPSTPFDELSLEDWRSIMTLNLDGSFVTVRAALEHLRIARWGRVVVISSSTVWVGVPTLVPYVTTKAGLIGFTRSLAAELGEHGITVNAITPGLMETDTVLRSSAGERFDFVVSRQIIKRRGQPQDLATALLFLCHPDSGFITGQTVNVDGGQAKH